MKDLMLLLERATLKWGAPLTLVALMLALSHCAPPVDESGPTVSSASTGGGSSHEGGTSAQGGEVGSGGSGLEGTGGEGGTVPPPALSTLVHAVSASQSIDGMHAAMAPDGTLYLVWGDKGSSETQIRLSRSTDGGQTFTSPVTIDNAGATVQLFGESAPRVAASNGRVAVAFTDQQGSDVWVTSADASAPINFSAPTALAPTGGVAPLNQFPALAFTPDDELWVAWTRKEVAKGSELVLRVFAARESEGFVAVAATDESNGRPCSCCGIHMLARSDGGVMVVFRGMDSPRNQFVVSHPGGPGGSWLSEQASNTNWEFEGCPENGPVLAEHPSGKVSLAWSDPTSGAGRVWLVDHTPGAGWHNERPATEGFAGQHTGALLAIAPKGRTWLGWKSWKSSTPSELIRSENGVVFEGPFALAIPEGNLFRPWIVAGPSGSFGFGIVNNQQLWMMSLP